MNRSKAHTWFYIVAAACAVFVALLLVIPVLIPFDPNATNLASALKAPGEDGFLLGSDAVGRDVLLRTLCGGSESVVLAFSVLVLVVAVGVFAGVMSGYFGGAIDYVINKIITAFQAFPSFVLAVAVAGVLGQGMMNMVVAIAAVYWTQFARLSRGIALSFRQSDCIQAAKMCGAPTGAILRKYVLPEVAGPVAVMAALSLSDIILTMAGLSFIGLGPTRPTNEWGTMIAESQTTFQYALWCMLVPMAALFIAVVLFNLLGETLRDVLDVRGHTFSRVHENIRDEDNRNYREPKDTRHKKLLKKGGVMQNKKKVGTLATFVVCCALACVLCSCTGQQSQSSSDTSGARSTSEKTLQAGSTTYFYAESMDPASDWDSWYLSYYGIVENLCRVNNNLTPELWLAKSITQVDTYTWEIELNNNITFSNGKPCNAQAVKAAWERTYANNSRAAETLALESVSAQENMLTVTTKEAVTSFESTLCDPLLCVYYVGDDVNYAQETPATGPYKMKSFKAENEIVLVANETYWNGTPKLSEVTLTCFASDSAITMAMQKGDIQAIAMPSASTAATLATNDAYVRTSNTSSRADFIRMNMTHALIQNKAIRTAVAYCVDREGYAQSICQGSAVASWGVYSETLPFGGTSGLQVSVSSCDVEAAKAALDAAGIVDTNNDGVRELDGTPVELSLYVCTRYERFVNLADDLQSKLAQAGIKLNIVTTDYFLEDAETFANDNPDMTLDSYAMAPTGDQAYFANMSFATNASNNFGKYSNSQVDALIAQLNATFDTAERNSIATQIAQQVLNDIPYIFFANSQAVVISESSVTGLDAAPSEYYFITVDTDVA